MSPGRVLPSGPHGTHTSEGRAGNRARLWRLPGRSFSSASVLEQLLDGVVSESDLNKLDDVVGTLSLKMTSCSSLVVDSSFCWTKREPY